MTQRNQQEITLTTESPMCCVCGKPHDECKCTVEELRERVEGLANLMVGFARLVRDVSPLALQVAERVLAQYDEDQEAMKDE